LRRSNIDASAGAVAEVARIDPDVITMVEKYWTCEIDACRVG